MAAACGAHVRQDGAGDVEQAEDVGLEHAAHFIGGGFFHGSEHAEAGIVDQYIDAPEVLKGLLGHGDALGFIRYVEVGSEQARLLAKTLSDAAGVASGGDDGITIGQGCGRDLRADATGSAGDEPDAVERMGSGHECVSLFALG
ncbi:hypothetical protein D3C73_690610 [compost metagenome]